MQDIRWDGSFIDTKEQNDELDGKKSPAFLSLRVITMKKFHTIEKVTGGPVRNSPDLYSHKFWAVLTVFRNNGISTTYFARFVKHGTRWVLNSMATKYSADIHLIFSKKLRERLKAKMFSSPDELNQAGGRNKWFAEIPI